MILTHARVASQTAGHEKHLLSSLKNWNICKNHFLLRVLKVGPYRLQKDRVLWCFKFNFLATQLI